MSLLQETKLILRKYDIRPREKLGQNFMVDEGVIRRQAEYADLKDSDVVLEVGAGIGGLTKVLLEKARRVFAIEKDRVLANILRERLQRENLEVIEGDALKISFPAFDKIVSNIPYSISSPLTFKILQCGFKRAVLTYQKEFADRMVASPGTKEYSRLSVATYYYAGAEILEVLGPEVFYPSPEVNSAVVRLTPKKRPFKVDEDLFFKTLRGLFIHRGKTVRKALYHSSGVFGFNILRKDWREALEKSIPREYLDMRVSHLKPEDVAEICNILKEIK